jgi:hypothetical protein
MSVLDLQNVSRTHDQGAAEAHALDSVSVSVDPAAQVLRRKIGGERRLAYAAHRDPCP